MRLSTFGDRVQPLVDGSGSAEDVIDDTLLELDPQSDDFRCAVAMLTREPYDNIGIGKQTVRTAAVESSLRVSSVDEIRQYESEEGSLPEALGANDTRDGLVPPQEITLSELYHEIERLRETSGQEQHDRIVHLLSSYHEPAWISHALLGKDGMSLGIGEKTVVNVLASQQGYEDYKTVMSLNPDVIELCVSLVDEDTTVSTGLEFGAPFRPMLAKSKSVPDSLHNTWTMQPKYDGARIVIHVEDQEIVDAFSRNAKSVADSLPELSTVASSFDTDGQYIVDGEVIPYVDGEKASFRHIMTRFGREEDVEEQDVDVEFCLFDMVYDDGEDIRDLGFIHRFKGLESVVNGDHCVRTLHVDDERQLRQTYERILELGYEGAVLKHMRAPYELGTRSSNWRKMVPEKENVDLRVTDVHEGENSQSGWVGSITVETEDGYTLGSVAESMEDRSGVRWDDRHKLIGRIAEISARELQHNGDDDYSLRFPSLEGYRHDKDSADTLAEVKKR